MKLQPSQLNLILVTLLSGSFVSGCLADSWTPYSAINSFSYGGPLPLKQVFNDLKGNTAPNRDDSAISTTHLELGGDYNGWRLGVFYRHDYYTRFHPDTLELLYLDKNNLPVESNRHYALQFEMHHLRAQGVRLSTPLVEMGPVTFRPGLILFHAKALMDGSIQGDITTNDSQYNGEAFVNYAYDEDVLLDRSADAPDGWGFGFNLDIAWQINAQWQLHATLEDLAGQVNWDRAPYTRAQITSSTVHFDEHGFIQTTPVLSGIESYTSHRQSLPLRSRLRLNYALSSNYDLFGGADRYGNDTFAIAGVTTKTRSGDYSIAWQTNSNALQLSWQNRYLKLALTADSLSTQKLRTFGFSLALHAP